MAVLEGPCDEALTRAVIPASYSARLVELATRFGVEPDHLLAGTGIEPAWLDQPEAKVSPAQNAALVARALELTGEPGLGFYYGLSLKLSSHGSVGLLAMTSATLRDAVRVAERYAGLRSPHVGIRSYDEGEWAVLEFEDGFPPGPLRCFAMESLITALLQMGRTLLGRPIPCQVELAYAEPAYFSRFAHLWSGPVRFNQAACRARFPSNMLEESLQMADSVTAKRMASECEEELARASAFGSLLTRLRQELRATRQTFPSLAEVARAHHMSERTLKRQLAARGTSYRQLVEEVRRERALKLLERGDHSIEEVSTLVGYSEVSNFHRAFRRWYGVSPDSWRKRKQA